MPTGWAVSQPVCLSGSWGSEPSLCSGDRAVDDVDHQREGDQERLTSVRIVHACEELGVVEQHVQRYRGHRPVRKQEWTPQPQPNDRIRERDQERRDRRKREEVILTLG